MVLTVKYPGSRETNPELTGGQGSRWVTQTQHSAVTPWLAARNPNPAPSVDPEGLGARTKGVVTQTLHLGRWAQVGVRSDLPINLGTETTERLDVDGSVMDEGKGTISLN